MKYLLIIVCLFAAQSLALAPKPEQVINESAVYYWVEPIGETLSWQQALQQATWIPSPGEFNLGYAHQKVWIRQDIFTPNKGDWILEIPYPLLDYLDLYLLQDKQLIAQNHTGDRRDFHTRALKVPEFVLSLNAQPLGQYQLLARIETEGTMMLPLHWRTEADYGVHLSIQNMIYGAYYGVLIIMALYHLFIFIVVREKSYLLYVLTLSAFMFLQMCFDGRGFAWLWPNAPGFNTVSFPLSYSVYIFTVLTFMSTFLQLKQRAKTLYRYFLLLRFNALLFALLIAFLPYKVIVPIIIINAMVSIVSGMLSGLFLWFKGYTAARFFTCAWGVFLFGLLLLNTRGFGLNESNWVSLYGYLIGSILEVLLLSFSLADRIKSINAQKRQVENQLLKSQQQNVITLRRYQDLYENAPSGNFQSNEHYQLVSVNLACAHMFGFISPEQMLDEVRDIRHYIKSKFTDFKRIIEQARRDSKVSDAEILIKDHQGQERWLSITMRFIENEGFEGALQDITARKKNERMQLELDRERMDILEKFSQGIAKEINSPLGSNVVCTAFLRESIDDILALQKSTITMGDYEKFTELSAKTLHLVDANQKRITRVLKRFREVSSQHLGLTRSQFSMLELINNTLEGERWKMPGWRVEVLGPTDLYVNSFAKAISIILVQLIDNAVAHYQSVSENSPKIWILFEKDHQDNVILNFTDNGEGINKEYSKLLGQPFFTTKNGPDGHIGLGLYMVYNLVNRTLGGRLFFPLTGNGFCVQLRLPINELEVPAE